MMKVYKGEKGEDVGNWLKRMEREFAKAEITDNKDMIADACIALEGDALCWINGRDPTADETWEQFKKALNDRFVAHKVDVTRVLETLHKTTIVGHTCYQRVADVLKEQARTCSQKIEEPVLVRIFTRKLPGIQQECIADIDTVEECAQHLDMLGFEPPRSNKSPQDGDRDHS